MPLKLLKYCRLLLPLLSDGMSGLNAIFVNRKVNFEKLSAQLLYVFRYIYIYISCNHALKQNVLKPVAFRNFAEIHRCQITA